MQVGGRQGWQRQLLQRRACKQPLLPGLGRRQTQRSSKCKTLRLVRGIPRAAQRRHMVMISCTSKVKNKRRGCRCMEGMMRLGRSSRRSNSRRRKGWKVAGQVMPTWKPRLSKSRRCNEGERPRRGWNGYAGSGSRSRSSRGSQSSRNSHGNKSVSKGKVGSRKGSLSKSQRLQLQRANLQSRLRELQQRAAEERRVRMRAWLISGMTSQKKEEMQDKSHLSHQLQRLNVQMSQAAGSLRMRGLQIEWKRVASKRLQERSSMAAMRRSRKRKGMRYSTVKNCKASLALGGKLGRRSRPMSKGPLQRRLAKSIVEM
mmetsp:Transcript_4086/g.9507  ORF Transcript_4086/g.9507 Transcript_4086/m.9507 type:complete len:315 (+) Transcript_4086:2263-3207(+)